MTEKEKIEIRKAALKAAAKVHSGKETNSSNVMWMAQTFENYIITGSTR